jgi:phosphate transport system permease protein
MGNDAHRSRQRRISIAGAVVLGLGRAVGETMAITMVIGNSPQISASLF